MDSHGDAPGPHKQLMIYMRKSSPLGGAAGHSCAGAAGTQLGDRRVGGLAQRLGQPPLQIRDCVVLAPPGGARGAAQHRGAGVGRRTLRRKF